MEGSEHRTDAIRVDRAMEGIDTFLGAPYLPPDAPRLQAAGARAAFMGIPYEGGTLTQMYRAGSSRGPRSARQASTYLSPYNGELDVDIVAHYGLHDCGDVAVTPIDGALSRRNMETAAGAILDAGAVPVFVGGDHSIPVPLARALSSRVTGQMGVLVLDTHLDAANEIDGDRFTNCSLHPRFIEFENVEAKNIAVVGIHGNAMQRDELDWARDNGINIFFQNDVWELGIEVVMREALDRVWDGVEAAYVSFDTDVVDAAYLPGTCSSEPGGLTSRELLKAARLIGARGLRQFDVSELSPPWDNNEISARLVVYFIINMLAANAWHEQSGASAGVSCIDSATRVGARA